VSAPATPRSARARRVEERLARRGGAVELLRLPAALFGAAAGLRGALYDRGWLPVERLDVPVVCVGNLTAGGTGKTPMVVWVARELQRRGLRPGLSSRGYGARAGEVSDEGRLLDRLLPGVPRVESADRARAGRELEARGCDAVVLDDGFQHRRLVRDLDLVLVDATRPWGLPASGAGGAPVRAFLPRGLLRESPRGLARAGAAVITRVDQADERTVEALAAELERWAPGLGVATARHRPVRIAGPGAESAHPGALAGREVDLVSGVGNPDAFEASVRALGARVHEHRRFADHHAYRPDDLRGLGEAGRWLLATAKDAVKLGDDPRLRVLEVELEIASGRSLLEALLDSLPAGRAQRQRRTLHEGLHG